MRFVYTTCSVSLRTLFVSAEDGRCTVNRLALSVQEVPYALFWTAMARGSRVVLTVCFLFLALLSIGEGTSECVCYVYI